MTDNPPTQFQNELRQGMVKTFSTSDLKILCTDLGIDYDNIPGDTKEVRILELIAEMNRAGRLAELVQACSSKRPNHSWPQASRRPPVRSLPEMADLFEIVHALNSDKVFGVISPQKHVEEAAPYSVPHVKGRVGVADVQEDLHDALTASGGRLLVQSRLGLGKTHEVAALATRLCDQGWTVCVARQESEKPVNPLATFPSELRDESLLLVIDDLHWRVRTAAEGQPPYTERLEALLAYLQRQTSQGCLRVLATTAQEPEHQKLLGFDPQQAPWKRFKRYDLPPFTLEDLAHILQVLAEQADVVVDPGEIPALVTDSDRTLRTLFYNVNHARRHGHPLNRAYWSPKQGDSWKGRFVAARADYPSADAVYQALHLVQQAGLPTRTAYVIQLSSGLAQVDTHEAVDSLVNMGLLWTHRNVLDVFSSAQLTTTLGELPVVNEHWDAVIRSVLEVTPRPNDWVGDLTALARRLLLARRHQDAETVADTAAAEQPVDAAVYFVRGVARYNQSNFAGAAADYSLAIARNPGDPEAHGARALALRMLGRWEEARAAYLQAVQLDPARGMDWLGLAACARHVGDEAGWHEAVDRARPLISTQDPYDAACLASVAGEVDHALAFLRQALQEQPEQASWAREEPDLDWVHEDPRFGEIVDAAAVRVQRTFGKRKPGKRKPRCPLTPAS